MSAQVVKKDKTIIHFIVYCLLASLGWIVPVVEPITPEGMHLIGVFFAAVYGWSVSTEVWPSFFTLLLIPFTGIVDVSGLLAISWGNDTIFFIVLLFVFVAFMEATGTTTYVSTYLLTRKSLAGHPWRMIFVVFFVAWLISSLCGIFSGMFISWGFVYKICDILDYKPFDKFVNVMVFGVGVMGAISLGSVPWNNNALIILNTYTATFGESINFLHYLWYSVPCAIFSILGYMLICKIIFRLDTERLKKLTPDFFDSQDLVLTRERKITLVALMALVIMLVVPSLLPEDNGIRVFFDTMGMSLKALLLFIVLSLLKKDGKYVFKFGELAVKGVPWNTVMMICAIFSFTNLLGNDKAGISAFLGQVLTPLFSDSSLIFFFILTLVITVILTNLMINMVVAVIMITATLPIAASLGVDSLQIVYLITVSCNIAFMLPAASAASVCLFSNTKWIRAREIYIYSIPTIIVMAVVTLLWNFVVFMF
ncbi:MAG: SLC13 family permease [Peptococcaceae bacterium]|nr:SLC13 family permease [Peptococcaceae bacterium]